MFQNINYISSTCPSYFYMATIIEGEEEISVRDRSVIKGQKGQNIQNSIRIAVCSELRRRIIIALREGKRTLSELRDSLGVSSTTAIHALRELEKENIIFQDESRKYGLTRIGYVIGLKLSDFVDAVEVLKKHEDFWLTHDLSGIPPHLLEKIGWLKGSILLEDTAIDIFKVHTSFINLLASSKQIRGVSSIFVPEYPPLFEKLILKKRADVELVITEEVFNKMLEVINQEVLKKAIKDENFKFKLYTVEENIKAAFTVTDYFLSLGLFHVDGSYDYNRDIISYGREAIEWGKELFEWYLKRAKPIFL